jgi:two-component system response regulator NreC
VKPIRVLLADDHAVLRSGLRMLIGGQADMAVVGEAGDGEEAVRVAAATHPDVALVDLTMPGSGGLQAIERIRRACPGTRVLALTMHETPAYVRAVLAAGGGGYVVKRAADTELLRAIRAVHQGRTVVDRDLADRVAATAGGRLDGARAARAAQRPPLSQREQEVLAGVAQGYTNQQVADQLGISVKTVETYRARLTEKLGLRTRAELVRFAVDAGLFGPGESSPPG